MWDQCNQKSPYQWKESEVLEWKRDLKIKEAATIQKLQEILEARKGNGVNSLLEPPEGMLSCQPPDFNIVKLISDYWSSEL